MDADLKWTRSKKTGQLIYRTACDRFRIVRRLGSDPFWRTSRDIRTLHYILFCLDYNRLVSEKYPRVADAKAAANYMLSPEGGSEHSLSPLGDANLRQATDRLQTW